PVVPRQRFAPPREYGMGKKSLDQRRMRRLAQVNALRIRRQGFQERMRGGKGLQDFSLVVGPRQQKAARGPEVSGEREAFRLALAPGRVHQMAPLPRGGQRVQQARREARAQGQVGEDGESDRTASHRAYYNRSEAEILALKHGQNLHRRVESCMAADF